MVMLGHLKNLGGGGDDSFKDNDQGPCSSQKCEDISARALLIAVGEYGVGADVQIQWRVSFVVDYFQWRRT